MREVIVEKQIDFESLRAMMAGLETKEVSRTMGGETRTKGQERIVERREVLGATAPTNPDDLKKVEGIGPKIEELLNNAGISTWRALSESSVETLKGILDEAGPRYRIHDPGTWAEQAKMAHEGKWDELSAWQDDLKGCLLYTSPSPRDRQKSRMPSSA